MSKIRFRVEHRVGHLVLDNPPDNRMDMIFFRQLGEAVREMRRRNDLGAAVIYGGKRHFSAGADLEDITISIILPLERGMSGADGVAEESLKNARIFMTIAELPIPVIAAVGGCCFGSGMELAMACDVIFCDRDAVFAQPEISWGLMTGCSGSIRLKNLVRSAKTEELLLHGTMISGQEAYDIGLANKVFDRGQALPAAIELAERLAAPSRYHGNALIKEALHALADPCRPGPVRLPRFVKDVH